MELGLYTDSVPDLSFLEALDLAARTGARALEIAVGGQSSAPHLRAEELERDVGVRAAFEDAIASRGLRLAALNCSAWPLHPALGVDHVEVIRTTIRLARLLGVTKIVSMSGNPGDGPAPAPGTPPGAPGASTIDWIFYPWPEDAVALRERQWDAAIELWRDLAAYAVDHGVTRIGFELHPLHLVYNVPTLLRIRDAVGPVIGANMDPSHLFWQRMDPIAVIRALGPAVAHVHLKDTEIIEEQVALAGVLDGRPFDDPAHRAWVFRTVGRVHDAAWWGSFVGALRDAGYDDALCIEHEDPDVPGVRGVEEGAAFMAPLLGPRPGPAVSPS